MPMKYYIQRSGSSGNTLFRVYDKCGEPHYSAVFVKEGTLVKILLLDAAHQKVATIRRIGVEPFWCDVIHTETGGRARLFQHLSSSGPQFYLSGVPWYFRGDFVVRSFDLLDAAGECVMTHGRCWNSMGESFGVEIRHQKSVVLGLCIAIAIDTVASSNGSAPVPIG